MCVWNCACVCVCIRACLCCRYTVGRHHNQSERSLQVWRECMRRSCVCWAWTETTCCPGPGEACRPSAPCRRLQEPAAGDATDRRGAGATEAPAGAAPERSSEFENGSWGQGGGEGRGGPERAGSKRAGSKRTILPGQDPEFCLADGAFCDLYEKNRSSSFSVLTSTSYFVTSRYSRNCFT